MARKHLTALPVACAAALGLAAAASAGNGGVAPLQPASKQAAAIRDVYYYAAGFAGFLLLAGAVWLAVALLRKGHGGEDHGTTRRPVVVAVVAVVALAAVGAFALAKLDGVKNAPAKARVVLASWDGSVWTFVHPDLGGVSQKGTLTLENGVPVALEISPKTSPGRFWVQQLGGAVDAIPHRQTSAAITPTRTGTFSSPSLDPGTGTPRLKVEVVATGDYASSAGGKSGG